MQQDTDLKPAALQILEQWDAMSRYEEVKTTKELERIVRSAKDIEEMSLDTETTGVDVITAKCLGYSFSFEAHAAYWVPIKTDPQMRLLKQLVKGKRVIFFNAGYDLAIIEKYGVTVPTKLMRDVMIACFFRDIPGYQHNAGLKPQAKLILSLPTVELKEIIMANTGAKKVKDDEVDFTTLEPWQQRVYGCQDADITMMLWQEKSIQEAVAMMPEIWELEHKLIRPVMAMYENGVGIDLDKCADFDAKLEQACADLSKKAHKMALKECATVKTDDGVTFENEELARLTKKKGLNLGSFKQKQILLFDELGVPPTRRVASGFSTDQEALSDIEGEHAIIPIVMQYNKLVSRRNSYTKKLPGMVNEVTGRIHPSLWATGVKSGRFSCSNPNMQGVSKDHADDDIVQIRELFVPAKGNVLTAADYSQIELRIAASLSQESVWCDAYNAGDIDVHTQTASEMYKVPFTKVIKDQRDIAKTANFSILTGISAYTLSARNRKTIPTQEMAQQLIDSWFGALPRLTEWIEEIKRRARVRGEMKTYFGRIRPFPEIRNPKPETIARHIESLRECDWAKDKDYDELVDIAIRSISAGFERKALSHIIQGTAADIMKIAILNVDKALRKAKMPVKMLLTVHDELLFEHSPKISDEFHALLQETMTFKQLGPGWVPLTIDIGCGGNWAEAH